MNLNTIIQWLVLVLLAVVLFTLVDPFMYWMPSVVQTAALTVAAALLAVVAAFVVAEKAGDEREIMLRMQAGRAAFLAGVLILTAALVYQGFAHTIDPWVPSALLGMVFGKLAARWYADR